MEDTVNIRYVVEFENAQNIFCSRSFPTREAAEVYAREHLQSRPQWSSAKIYRSVWTITHEQIKEIAR